MGGKRIFISKKSGFDIISKKYLDNFNEIFHGKLSDLKVYYVYDIFGVNEEDFKLVVDMVLKDPVTDDVFYHIDLENCDYIATELLPGQFDIRSHNGMQSARLIASLGDDFHISCGEIVVFNKKIDNSLLNNIKKYLINPAEKREKEITKIERSKSSEKAEILDVKNFKNFSDNELIQTKEALGINLDLETLQFIQKYYKENNYDCYETELYIFDTYWSDHCRHTTFNTHLKNISFDNSINSDYVKKSYEKYLRQRNEINSTKPITLMDIAIFNAKYLKKNGGLKQVEESEEINAASVFAKVNDEDWLIMFKNETHNHPTEIEPFGGASTCLGGAIRDPLSGRSYVYQGIRITGAADPTEDISKTLERKLPQRKICKDAALGFASYGNQIGLATTFVKEIYHPSYVAKRLELGAVVGAAPAKNVLRISPLPKDLILILGGRTGKDGIGGASGSSLTHTEESLENSISQIQKGNPLEERKLQRLFKNFDFTTLVKKCNDFGAGGVCVAIGELADGIEINLEKIRLKTENLSFSQIAISESQERMAIVIDKKDLEKVLQLADSENVEVTIVGTVTEDKKLVMKYHGEIVASIDREFLDTNGLEYNQDVFVSTKKYGNYDREKYRKLNSYSQKGLIEIFDNSVGASTILSSCGGKNQITTELGSVQSLPVQNGNSDVATVVTYGFNPIISEKSPYFTGLYSIVEAVTKQIALGANLDEIYISMQEFFPSLKEDKEKWGLVFSGLLGAFEAMDNLGLGAIGGKDSMSGSFENIDVISTIVAFGFSVINRKKVISRVLKKNNSFLYFVPMKTDENGFPNFNELRNNFKNISMIREEFLSISNVEQGIFQTLLEMSYGNDIGFKITTELDINKNFYGSFLIESSKEINVDGFYKIGSTSEKKIDAYEMLKKEYLEGLFDVYPFIKNVSEIPSYKKISEEKVYFPYKVENPKALIICFSGTNSEIDMERSFKRAGAETEILVINNSNEEKIKNSINQFCEKIKNSHILVFPGGFSFSDEPDGSGKFIANFLKNKFIKESVHEFLDQKKLILGICNGFQGLIKSGLLPYGKITEVNEESPTLFFNDNFRHISKLSTTEIASNRSPWLQDLDMNKKYVLPISHGEGKFVATEEMLKYLKENDMIATRYSENQGISENPNGSVFEIEGIVSPNGQILGKMAHNERSLNDLFVNVEGEKFQDIFTSCVNYFRNSKEEIKVEEIFLYEGKAKTLYDIGDGKVKIFYRDDATAFNGIKKDVLAEKGVYNNKISAIIYKYLEANGIKTHFIEKISDREQICKKVTIIPLEVIIRNIAAGSMAKRLGIEEGKKLKAPVFELSYKDDALQDPLINDDHAIALDLISKEDLQKVKETALKINSLLKKLFEENNITLVDFKIEFGRDSFGEIVLADEISPDTCRFWESDTLEKFDKDRFRRDLTDVMKGYLHIYTLLEEIDNV